MSRRRIYLASSWRNTYQPELVELLRDEGHQVYDFRHPTSDDDGFHWSEIDERWQNWDAETYRSALTHEVALKGFASDFDAMLWADTFILLLPCGRSAHLEAGWATGRGIPTAIYLDGEFEPELMYKLADIVVLGHGELCEWLDWLSTAHARTVSG